MLRLQTVNNCKGQVSLTFDADFGYNQSVKEGVNRIGLGGMVMKKFYYEKWVPFIFNKRRILLLAIASYIALC